MKILWISDPPQTSSAYGQQTALFVSRLRTAGHEVSILATGNAVMQRLPDGTLLLPVVSDRHGNSIVASHAKVLGADLVITLMDPHVFDMSVYQNLPWCAWAPLDFETPTKATLGVLEKAKWVWSPSKHGVMAYQKAGVAAAHVPHGVDSRVFDLQDRNDARSLLATSCGVDIPDNAFLVVAVAANRGTPSRKGFYEMLASWKLFTDAHPSALLYLHTDLTGLGGIGENLYDIMDLVGLKRGVIFPPQYHYLCGALGPDHLAAAYNAADVYLSTSHGEGFGIGLVEAKMCGCPAVVSDNTAQTELSQPYERVPTLAYMPFDGATTWRRPIVEDTHNERTVVKALENCWRNQGEVDRAGIRDRALPYDVDRVFEQWMVPELNRIAEEIAK